MLDLNEATRKNLEEVYLTHLSLLARFKRRGGDPRELEVKIALNEPASDMEARALAACRELGILQKNKIEKKELNEE